MRLKIQFALPEFLLNPKKLRMEFNPVCNRVYFLLGNRLLAVAIKLEDVGHQIK